jgi:hypothetical protein
MSDFSHSLTLHSTDDPYGIEAIQGNYSIFLQGGSFAVPSTSYSSIGQTGQIPSNAKSLIYWGGALQVTFNGQPLAPYAIGTGPNYTIWGADISAYAGQSGQLQFTATWQTSGILDNIQFSSVSVPEPSSRDLILISLLFLVFHKMRCNKLPSTITLGACRSAVAIHVASRRWFSFPR